MALTLAPGPFVPRAVLTLMVRLLVAGGRQFMSVTDRFEAHIANGTRSEGLTEVGLGDAVLPALLMIWTVPDQDTIHGSHAARSHLARVHHAAA